VLHKCTQLISRGVLSCVPTRECRSFTGYYIVYISTLAKAFISLLPWRRQGWRSCNRTALGSYIALRTCYSHVLRVLKMLPLVQASTHRDPSRWLFCHTSGLVAIGPFNSDFLILGYIGNIGFIHKFNWSRSGPYSLLCWQCVSVLIDTRPWGRNGVFLWPFHVEHKVSMIEVSLGWDVPLWCVSKQMKKWTSVITISFRQNLVLPRLLRVSIYSQAIRHRVYAS
jgi:hypothetical protein